MKQTRLSIIQEDIEESENLIIRLSVEKDIMTRMQNFSAVEEIVAEMSNVKKRLQILSKLEDEILNPSLPFSEFLAILEIK